MTIVKFQRGITTKLYRKELRFLCSALRLMMLYISMKFQDNILNGFQLREDTKLLFSHFKGELLQKCTDKSYGSCGLYVV